MVWVEDDGVPAPGCGRDLFLPHCQPEHHQPPFLAGPTRAMVLFIRELHPHGTEEHLIPPSPVLPCCTGTFQCQSKLERQDFSFCQVWLEPPVVCRGCVHSSGLPSLSLGRGRAWRTHLSLGLQLLWALLVLLLPALPTSPECPFSVPCPEPPSMAQTGTGHFPPPLGSEAPALLHLQTKLHQEIPTGIGCCQGFSQGISSCSLLPFIFPRAACF